MKKLHSILSGSEIHWVGNGFPVHSVFSYDEWGEEMDPFLLLDYGAPHFFPPGHEKRGVGAHPHRGFETVTLCFHGEVEHRDSNGGGGRIGPGDVQWMTAASGLLHEEFHSAEFTRTGGVFEMVQLWVNLPARDKSAAPRYQTLRESDIPVLPLPEGAGDLRLIAGSFGGRQGPAKTFTPITLWDIRLNPGASATLVVGEGQTAAFLVLQGQAPVDAADGARKIGPGELALFGREGRAVPLQAAEEGAHLLLLGGKPIGEPIVGRGPFVMNSEAEIREAFQDVRSGRMGKL